MHCASASQRQYSVVVQILGSEARLPVLDFWILGPVLNIMVPQFRHLQHGDICNNDLVEVL